MSKSQLFLTVVCHCSYFYGPSTLHVIPKIIITRGAGSEVQGDAVHKLRNLTLFKFLCLTL